MNKKVLENIYSEVIRRVAITSARDWHLNNVGAAIACRASILLDSLYAPDGWVRPTVGKMFAVWVPRGSRPGQWHRAVDGTGHEGTIIVHGDIAEWMLSGKLYTGYLTTKGNIPDEISVFSADWSIHDVPIASIKERMTEYSAAEKAEADGITLG